jgi:hypothetical protein
MALSPHCDLQTTPLAETHYLHQIFRGPRLQDCGGHSVKNRTDIRGHLLAVRFVEKQGSIQLGYVTPTLIDFFGKQPRRFAYNLTQKSCCRDVLGDCGA